MSYRDNESRLQTPRFSRDHDFLRESDKSAPEAPFTIEALALYNTLQGHAWPSDKVYDL